MACGTCISSQTHLITSNSSFTSIASILFTTHPCFIISIGNFCRRIHRSCIHHRASPLSHDINIIICHRSLHLNLIHLMCIVTTIITKPSLQLRDLAANKKSRCNHHQFIAAITIDLAAIITKSSLQSRDLDRQSLLQNCLLLQLRSTEKGRLIKANLANEHNTAKAQYER